MNNVIDRAGPEELLFNVASRVIANTKQAMEAKMNAVVAHEPVTSMPAVVTESSAIIQMIERAALNPQVDIDKMERLLQMQERIMERQAKAAYDAAFADMQNDLPEIGERGGIKDRNGKVQSRYALWEDINEAIKPVLARHGFGISFRTGQHDGRIVVTGVLSHREGHREETTMELPTDTSGSKNAVQAVGSSTSYGKRYTACALLNLTSRGEDDDGKAAGQSDDDTITDVQASVIRDLIKQAELETPKFCDRWNVGAVTDIPVKQFNEVVQSLRQRVAYLTNQRAQAQARTGSAA